MANQTIENVTIIRKLTEAGLVPESRYGKELTPYRHSVSAYYRRPSKISYKIPIDVYKKVIGKKFMTPLKLNSVVRVRTKSKRSYTRRTYRSDQDTGDIYKWGHLGIGSGKSYIGEEHRYRHIGNHLTIGDDYIMNIKNAHALEKKYRELGCNYKTESQYSYTKKITSYLFFERVELQPTGLFGPKRLINGYITEIYVHFVYPTWKFKREARYQVTFDTGAVGIFTSDMLDRVFDTDYEVDESLYCCDDAHSKDYCRRPHSWCDHMGVHVGTEECLSPCQISNKKCNVVYDFTQLCETTIQRGTGEDEKEN